MRVLMAARPRHNQSRTRQERSVELPNRSIKTKRSLLHHPIFRGDTELSLKPSHVVIEPFPCNHNTFSPTRRTRRIYYVSRVLRVTFCPKVRFVLTRHLLPLRIHIKYPHSFSRRNSA